MSLQFSSRNLTQQYISLSYQDVVQRYTEDTASYFLDGMGYVIGFIPTASLGQQILTADQPSPPSISSSYALTASFALNGDGTSASASWASHSYTSEIAESSLTSFLCDTASVALESMFADTASLAFYANFAGSASYSISSSLAETASYAFNAASASYATTCSVFIFSDITRSFTFTTQAEFATQSLFATQSISASYALTASVALNAAPSISSSWASSSLSSSFALTASYAVYPASIVSVPNNATSSIISILNSIYNSMFVNYVLTDTQNFRAGNIVVLYTTSSTVLTETCTTDIGNSDGLHFSASLSASYVNLLVVNTTNSDYSVKYHYDTL